eukprot:PITA_29637
MALMSKCVVTEPSSFEEAVGDPAWVDAMVEEYDSIVRNSAWEIVPRPEGKSMMGWHIHQMDVKTAFLNGVIEEEVYIKKPEGFKIFSSESHVCRLKRELYGLKQAPRAWYTRLDNYFTGLGFSKSEVDPNLYQIVVEGQVCPGDTGEVQHAWLQPVDTPLPGGWRKEDATSTEEVDATVYQQLVGSLMYLVNTRPDICYAVNHLSQAMVKPTKIFWKAGKHVLRYLRGTSGYGLWYRQEDEVKLCGFTDADWAGSPMDKKSTSGGIFSIGSTTVSWYSRKQRSAALSSAETEYMVASLAACEAIWMRKILVGLFGSHLEPTVIYCDNQSCIKLSTNLAFHDRSKHIDIMYHHVKDCVQRRIMLLSYIPTEDQDADILTKALTRSKFEYHRDMIGVADNPYLVEREC